MDTMLQTKFCLHIRGMNALVYGFLAYDMYMILEVVHRLLRPLD